MRRFPKIDCTRNGFSLVELMIVVAIIGLIAVFGTPALLSMKAKSNVRADARDVYSTLKYIQSEAVKRSDSICVLFNTPSGGDYTVFIDNKDNGTQDGGEATLDVKNLRPGSSFGINSGWLKACFNARGLPVNTVQGSVDITSSALQMKLSLSNAGFIKSTVI